MAELTDLVVPDALDGERVDKVVAVLFGVSRAVARQLVDRGVKVDGVEADPSDRVSAGSVVSAPDPTPELAVVAEPVEFGVLYEDDDLVVIDKPAGLVVHPGTGRSSGTLASGLLYRYPELEGVGDPGRWGLVHRLDKDTSGVLVVARNQETLSALSRMLAAREIRRTYTALAQGLFESPTGTIDAPIGRDPTRPMLRTVTHDGKPARTHYEVVASFPDHDVTLLTARLETGRTHQIRVHFTAIDHPIVGDTSYGYRPRRFSAPRTFLHASEIGFTHPRSGEELTVVSPLPADLVAVLESLGYSDSSTS